MGESNNTHYDDVRRKITDTMRQVAPCPAGPCTNCLYTGVDNHFVREGFNGEFAVLVIRAAP